MKIAFKTSVMELSESRLAKRYFGRRGNVTTMNTRTNPVDE